MFFNAQWQTIPHPQGGTNLHYLLEVSSSNVKERFRSFDVKMGATFSVYFTSLCVILNDIGAAEKNEREINFGHVMDCVGKSVRHRSTRVRQPKITPKSHRGLVHSAHPMRSL